MKRVGARLIENPFKRRFTDWSNERVIEIRNKNLVPLFEEMNSHPIYPQTLKSYQDPLQQWDGEKVMRILFRNLNQWFVERNCKHLLYLALVLDCDVPILEALYWIRFKLPLSQTFLNNLYHWTPERIRPHSSFIMQLLRRICVVQAVGTSEMYNRMLAFIQEQSLLPI